MTFNRAQEMLREGATLESLLEKYAIKSRRHEEFPELVLLKYNQIESMMGEEVVQHSRGVILDSSDNWRIVSRPFDKFFNLGEGHAAQLDWSSAQALEKIDGSLIQMYWYAGAWRVGTSGTPDASGDVNGLSMTFAELFWRVWNELGYQLPLEGERDLTFLFELTTPFNRVVVRHRDNGLTLIGVRSQAGYEYLPAHWKGIYNVVKTYDLNDPVQIEATFAEMDPLQQEGYVVVDANFRRVKVKHPGYVAIHHMKDGFGPKRVLDVVRNGESSELLTHFPEWTDQFNTVKSAYEAFADELSGAYEAIKGIPIQKDFALQATKTKCSAALFQARAGKVKDVKDFLRTMRVDALTDLLGLKDAQWGVQ